MKTLTIKQREALERIQAVRNLQVKKLQEVIAANAHMAGSTPSQWVLEYTLETVHHVTRQHIKALISKGYLERRSTDGWGWEVRIV